MKIFRGSKEAFSLNLRGRLISYRVYMLFT